MSGAVRYGSGAIHRLPELVRSWGGRRVLLVCGAGSFEASGAVGVLATLTQVAQVRRWSGFRPNTDAADLVEGLAIAADLDPDVIVGVGGGSTLDMAKLLCAFPGVTDGDKLAHAIRAGLPAPVRDCRLVLAPTTSGSGSEATHFAVVYLGSEKYSVGGQAMRPDAVLLDPDLTLSGTAYQRAASGLDAVAQAVESLWAAGATDESRRYARRALRVLMPAIEDFVRAPAAGSARAMTVGSHLAGRAIDISKTTAAHALSYAITKRYDVSHGHAVALTLGAFIGTHGEADEGRLQPGVTMGTHTAALSAILDALGATSPVQAGRRWTELGGRLGLPMRLAEIGVETPDQLGRIASAVNAQRMGNNPVRFTTEELTDLMRRAF
ncbi:phosphonoacetaldehyde reductase [Nonomuraea sediminis]|uniref:phosphonoacetaldehyde reductase n=1 Tax=Nonomuraea sediminis TaxID=2835864 RepID=UPI001BDC533F|nr:phosphonoacetaldehyde reductase [Nonomuraea sediminis]